MQRKFSANESPPQPSRPTRAMLDAAYNTTVPDLIARDLKVLFCGINPSLYSAAVGHHFARPGNRFWPALFASGFTDRLLLPSEENILLASGYGITNVVSRATAVADELKSSEYAPGAKSLTAKINRYRPHVLAIVGVGAYRLAFKQPRATLGKQAQTIGTTTIWVLPNPSGLNAHYQPADLAKLFTQLRLFTEQTR